MRSWVAVCGLALLVCATLAAAGPATADDCGPPPRQPQIDVQTDIGQAKLNHSRGIVALTAQNNGQAAPGMGADHHTLGSTEIDVSRQIQYELTGWQRDDGNWCWSIVQAQLEVTVETMVYIASEIPRDSCAWKEVVAHETLHVNLDRELLPSLVAALRAGALRVANETILAATGEAATSAAKERLSAVLGDVARRYSAERNTRQLAIDTPEEYSRFEAACGQAEMLSILASAGIR